MVVHDLYIKITPKKGEPFIRVRRVWDGARFVAAITAAETKEGNTLKILTRDDYFEALSHRKH